MRLSQSSRRWVLAAAVLGSSIVFLDSSVVNVALPRIGQELPRAFVGELEGQSYVYFGYLLTLSSLLILAGGMSDRFGRREVFAAGLLGFGVTSLLCGLAPTMEALIAARLLQGAAAAFLVPGSLSLLRSNFSGAEQGRAFGLWTAATSAATLGGPFVGGVLVDTVSWRAVFFINVPLVILALYATWRHVPESRDEEAAHGFDLIGAALGVVAVGGLSFGAIYGEQRDWQSPLAYALIALGLAATAVLPFWMRRSAHPLVPLELFRSRNFTVTNLSTLLIYGALYVVGQYLTLLQQGTLGYTAAAAGLTFVPGSVLMILLSPRFGSLSGRYGPRWFMAVGPAIMALGLLSYVRIPASSVPWQLQLGHAQTYGPPGSYLVDFLPGAVLFGLGLSLMVAPLTTAVMTSVPSHNSGVASAVNNAISRVGPQLMGALLFAAVTAVFYSALSQHLPGVNPGGGALRSAVAPLNRPTSAVGHFDQHQLAAAAKLASVDAFHVAMLLSAALLLVGALINAAGIRNVAPRDEASIEASAASAAAKA